MAGTRAGAMKRKANMIAKLGSEAAYRVYMQEIGAEGGRNGHTGGWYRKPELAAQASKLAVETLRKSREA